MPMTSMAITLDDFLQYAEQLADQVLQSGMPLEILHEGRILRLAPASAPKLTQCLIPHPGVITGNPTELENTDWSQSRRPDPDAGNDQ